MFETPGFVNFPVKGVKPLDVGKTYIYIVAIDVTNDTCLSNTTVCPNGHYCGSDLDIDWSNNSLNIDEKVKELSHDERNIEKYFVSSVLVGWSDMTYYKDNSSPWLCHYDNLTEHGQRLYFSLKKLHYDKDIKILTFNHIKNN